MAKLKKSITGVPTGEIYPRQIAAGEECPANLVRYATEVGAFGAEPAPLEQPASDGGQSQASETSTTAADARKVEAAKKDGKAAE